MSTLCIGGAWDGKWILHTLPVVNIVDPVEMNRDYISIMDRYECTIEQKKSSYFLEKLYFGPNTYMIYRHESLDLEMVVHKLLLGYEAK